MTHWTTLVDNTDTLGVECASGYEGYEAKKFGFFSKNHCCYKEEAVEGSFFAQEDPLYPH